VTLGALKQPNWSEIKQQVLQDQQAPSSSSTAAPTVRQVSNAAPMCGSCEEDAATKWCVECSKLFCDDCHPHKGKLKTHVMHSVAKHLASINGSHSTNSVAARCGGKGERGGGGGGGRGTQRSDSNGGGSGGGGKGGAGRGRGNGVGSGAGICNSDGGLRATAIAFNPTGL
jgi:hypothetical protein